MWWSFSVKLFEQSSRNCGPSEKKMSVLINFLQNTNLVSVLAQILLVMSDRTDKFCELCLR